MFASKDTLLTRPSGGYTIARSVRTRASASGNFTRTPATATNRKTFTWSGWVKRGTLSTYQNVFGATTGGYPFLLRFDNDNTLFVYQDGTADYGGNTYAVYRDVSAWYHIVLAIDTTQATDTNRLKLYVNGVQNSVNPIYGYFGLNVDTSINSTGVHSIGGPSANFFDGYLTEINFVDGQALTPSSFGETDSITGVWKPKAYSGTYGTNGFELNFSDNSASTATTIGKDYSGNGNNWTPNNISVTAGVTYDSMQDVPTLTSLTAANYAVINPIAGSTTTTISNANLTQGTNSGGVWGRQISSIAMTSGQWYMEITVVTVGDNGLAWGVTNSPPTVGSGNQNGEVSGYSIFIVAYFSAIPAYNRLYNAGYTTLGGSSTVGDVYGIAFDADTRIVKFFQNGSVLGSSGGYTLTSNGQPYYFQFLTENGSLSANWGQRPFTYTAPTGYVALNTYNLPASTITNGAAYMAATLYTGTGASLTVANTVGSTSFQPDWVWVKSRSAATDHALYDSVRGVQKQLESNQTGAETTETTGLTAFGSTGFTVGALAQMNTSAATYVAWQWKASGSTVSNTNGSITSTVSAGATQGFSVVTFTAPSSGNFSAGHGLGVTPGMVITKVRGRVTNWITWHNQLNSGSPGTTYYIDLNLTGGQSTFANVWGSTGVTSSVIGMGVGASCAASDTIVAYCFSAVAGYSAFGSYTGNGSADGTFVYTGFRPRWVMIKCSSTTGNWIIWDSSRGTYNVIDSLRLYPNLSDVEGGGVDIDFVSNGFKFRNTNAAMNGSGSTYIYMAFAENPFRNALAR